MGYQMTKILIYGIQIPELAAKRLQEKFSPEDGCFFIKSKKSFSRKLGEYSISKGETQNYPITPYKQHDDGQEEVFHPTLISDGTDSRIHSLEYDEGFDHYVGIFIASNGYGYLDKVNYFLKNPPPEAVIAFNEDLLPILKTLNVELEPELLILNQMW